MDARRSPVDVDVDDVSVSYGAAPVLEAVGLHIEPGELVSLLGPSGCGKTTLLRAIAGLEPVVSGTIRLGGTVVSGPGVHLPPERRRIGMVFQDWALFPHLSVGANIAYGLDRSERRSRARVGEVLEMVGLSGYENRSPHTLSGGQQQRVALARALAPRPSVLLLDEPFSNLDAALRVMIRTEVHRLLQELDVTAVFVTHDQDEAFVLGHRVAVLRRGRVEQWGRPADVYERPVNPWVARFVGEANLVRAVLRGSVADTPFGPVEVEATPAGPSDGAVQVLVRPEQLALGDASTAGRGASGRVTLVEYCGRDTLYEVGLDADQRLRCRLSSGPRFAVGDAVIVRYVGGACMPYDAESAPAAPERWSPIGELEVAGPELG